MALILFSPQAVDYELKAADELNQAKRRIQENRILADHLSLQEKLKRRMPGLLYKEELSGEYETSYHEAANQLGNLKEAEQKIRTNCNQVRRIAAFFSLPG